MHMPTGGVTRPTPIMTVTRTPRTMGSMPTLMAMGKMMVPMMINGISSAGQLPLKVRQSSFHSKWPCSGWTFSFLAKM